MHSQQVTSELAAAQKALHAAEVRLKAQAGELERLKPLLGWKVQVVEMVKRDSLLEREISEVGPYQASCDQMQCTHNASNT